jgi:hypothetical protein
VPAAGWLAAASASPTTNTDAAAAPPAAAALMVAAGGLLLPLPGLLAAPGLWCLRHSFSAAVQAWCACPPSCEWWLAAAAGETLALGVFPPPPVLRLTAGVNVDVRRLACHNSAARSSSDSRGLAGVVAAASASAPTAAAAAPGAWGMRDGWAGLAGAAAVGAAASAGGAVAAAGAGAAATATTAAAGGGAGAAAWLLAASDLALLLPTSDLELGLFRSGLWGALRLLRALLLLLGRRPSLRDPPRLLSALVLLLGRTPPLPVGGRPLPLLEAWPAVLLPRRESCAARAAVGDPPREGRSTCLRLLLSRICFPPAQVVLAPLRELLELLGPLGPLARAPPALPARLLPLPLVRMAAGPAAGVPREGVRGWAEAAAGRLVVVAAAAAPAVGECVAWGIRTAAAPRPCDAAAAAAGAEPGLLRWGVLTSQLSSGPSTCGHGQQCRVMRHAVQCAGVCCSPSSWRVRAPLPLLVCQAEPCGGVPGGSPCRHRLASPSPSRPHPQGYPPPPHTPAGSPD